MKTPRCFVAACLLLSLVLFPAPGHSQAIAPIFEEPDSVVEEPPADMPEKVHVEDGGGTANVPPDSIEAAGPSLQFIVGEWRGLYILGFVLPVLISIMLMYGLYVGMVDRWVAAGKYPHRLRSASFSLGIVLSLLLMATTFVLILEFLNPTFGLIVGGVLALVLLIMALVTLR